MHERGERGESAKFVVSRQDDFSNLFCSMTHEMRRNSNACALASAIVATISSIQLIGYSFIGANRRPSDDRILSMIYDFFALFCSVVGRECEDYELFSTVACLVIILLLSAFVMIVVMRMYQFANMGVSRYFSLIPVIPLYGSRALFNPMAALTVRSIIFGMIHDSNYASGAWPLSIVAVGASFASSLLLYISHVCYPNSPSSACVGWCWPMSIEILIGCPAILFCECAGHVDPVIQEFLAVLIVVGYLLHVYILVTEMREMSDMYAKTKMAVLILCSVNYIVYLLGGQFRVQAAVMMVMSLPVFAGSRRVYDWYKDENLRKLTEAIESGNYEPLKCYSETGIACVLGRFCSHIYGNERIFSWVIENYPDSFDVAWVYVKFACFYGLDLTAAVQQLSKTKHRFWLSVFNFAYLDITFFSDEDLLEQHCANAKNEYKYNLMLFWTEVLLGRNERLMELVSVIHMKWIKVMALYEKIGRDHDHFRQFMSIISLKIRSGDEKDALISYDHQQNFDTLVFKERIETRDVDQESKRFGPIEIHLRRYTAILTTVIHLLRFLWFYIMVALVLFLSFKLRQYGSIVERGISFFHGFSNITQQLGSLHLGMALTPWVQAGILKDEHLRHIIGPNRLYYWISNASTWQISPGLDDLEEAIIPFTEELLNISMKGLLSRSSGNSFKIGEFGNLSVLVRMFLVKSRGILERHPRHKALNVTQDVEDFMNFSHHTFLVMNRFINSTLKETYDQIALVNESFHWSMVSVIIGFAVLLVILTIANCHCMKKYFNELMKPLFFIPKADISELRNRLGNTPMAAWKSPEIPAQVKYNMHELAEMPRHSMSTDQRLLYRWVLFNVAIGFTFSFIMFNVTTIMRVYYNEHAKGYQAIGYAVVFQNRLLQLSRLSIDIAYRHYHGLGVSRSLLSDLDWVLADTAWHMANMQSEIAKLSPIIDASIFDSYPATGNISDSFDAYPYYSRCSYLLGHLAVFHNWICFTRESLIPEDLSILFTATLTTIGDAIPELREAVFRRYNLHALAVTTKVRIIWTLLICFMLLAALAVYMWIPANGPLVDSVFQTIPSRVVHDFNQYLDLQDTSALQLASEIADQMLNSESTFSLLDDLVLLVNKSNVVVKASTRFSSFLEIDQTIEGQEITEILNHLTDEFVDITLPPTEEMKFRFNTKLRTNIVELQAQFSPISDAMFGEDVIAYMVIFTDVTKIEAMKIDLQNEINRVRMLVTQLVPEIAVKAVLENERFAPMMVQKMIATYVCFTEMKDLTTPWPFKELQRIVQETLARSKKLTFRGKSIQQFFVLSGLSENSLPLMEQAIESIKFGMELIRRVKEYQARTNTQFNIGIGVHAIGPCFAELTSSVPPIFEVSAPNMVIPTLVANYCSQNQVNITRDVYILVIALGYSIMFENEIQDLTGETLSVHYVQSM